MKAKLRSLITGICLLIVLPAIVGLLVALIFSQDGILFSVWLKSAAICNVSVFLWILIRELIRRLKNTETIKKIESWWNGMEEDKRDKWEMTLMLTAFFLVIPIAGSFLLMILGCDFGVKNPSFLTKLFLGWFLTFISEFIIGMCGAFDAM